MGARTAKQWTAAGAARAARDARIATAQFLREAPIARAWQASKMVGAFQLHTAHLATQTDERTARRAAAELLFTGLGYPETWRPNDFMEAAERVLADQAKALAEADLYILSPNMCDVVVAAAQSLTFEDLSLVSADDLPSLSGLLVLPQPLMVKAVNGNLGDDRAYQWQSPIEQRRPSPAGRYADTSTVRLSLYHDSHGPVRPDSFLDFENLARSQGTPLPPLLLDAMRCIPFGVATTDEQLQNLAKFGVTARAEGQRARSGNRELGFEEERVVGEYTPGSEIDDPDDSFTARFLYAFWRLCQQQIAITTPAETRHAARVTAEKAGVSPDVRVVQLRPSPDRPSEETAGTSGRQWQHRWVVRMHKVRQWYPSEQRHKVIYRGPYIKGPDGKPLLGGDVVRGLTR
ncbi:hypothetical protein ACVDFE_17715 [Lentzea chajnantorensis]